jgi:hypothetical protein
MAGASGIPCLQGVPIHVSKALEADYKGKHVALQNSLVYALFCRMYALGI